MTPFSDRAGYLAVPGLVSLRLAPDGSWLAAAVKTLGRDPKKYVTSIWRIGTGPGAPPPARLTRSAAGAPGPVPIRQMLVTYFFGSRPSVLTAAASQDPSGASRSDTRPGTAR